MLRTSFASFICALLLCNAAAAKSYPHLPAPFDEYYGIYLKDHKVGWMRSRLLTQKGTAEFRIELHAQVAGMGQAAELTLTEARAYNTQNGDLVTLSFVQNAATGSVRVLGQREGGQMALSITAGEATQKQKVARTESLDDALVPYELAKRAKVGESKNAVHFDPSILKLVQSTYTVRAVEMRPFGGVATRVVRIDNHFPELGVTETGWIDAKGSMLENQIGGFFQARLESEEIAKRLDIQQDLLLNSVVKTPKPIAGPTELNRLTLQMTGFGTNLPPTSSRQAVTKSGDQVIINLSRETRPLQVIPLSSTSTAAVLRAHPELAEYVKSTPFIQSDAPQIKNAAQKIADKNNNAFDVVSKLAAFVYSHIRDEYVPAYSNALEAYNSGRGDCTEHSVLFVAMARALGIPARVAVGVAYWPPGDGFGWHAWAEVFLGNQWYTVDPTWNQPIADATHLKLADGGPAEQARLVMLLGNLHVVSVQGSK